MNDPLQAVAEYMQQRSWRVNLGPMLSADPDTARKDALTVLEDAGLSMSFEDIEAILSVADCPTCALTTFPLPAEGFQSITRIRAMSQLWNYLPREELGGLSPVESLNEAIASRPDEEPWRVAAKTDHQISEFCDAEYFRGLPSPSEFGLGEDFVRMAEQITTAALTRPGRNRPCPCGSGRKYKKCCLRLEGTTL